MPGYNLGARKYTMEDFDLDNMFDVNATLKRETTSASWDEREDDW